jgi:hypothetical protein
MIHTYFSLNHCFTEKERDPSADRQRSFHSENRLRFKRIPLFGQ